MEKAKQMLALKKEDLDTISQLPISQHQPMHTQSFFERFYARGIKVQQIKPGFVSCTFKVPPRLTDATGNFSPGAIANLVDGIGLVTDLSQGHPFKVSVDMSISYISQAKVDDELEIVGRSLGHREGFSNILVTLRSKTSGELIAEGRHSLYYKPRAKI